MILAHRAVDHAIIIGYGHLGERIFEWFAKEGRSVVVVEKDSTKVLELIHQAVPVVVADASAEGVLEETNVKHAHDVVQTFNDVRTALILAHRVHTLNPNCELHARCHDDKVQKVLENLGAKPFSTDSWIVDKLRAELPRSDAKVALVGYNDIAKRFISWFQEVHRPFILVERDPAVADLVRERELPIAKGYATDIDFLRDQGIGECEVALICIEYKVEDIITIVSNLLSLNQKKPILVYARVFDDEIAQVIESMGGHAFLLAICLLEVDA